MISKNSKIYVAGHKGMVGSAILKKLKTKTDKKTAKSIDFDFIALIIFYKLNNQFT